MIDDEKQKKSRLLDELRQLRAENSALKAVQAKAFCVHDIEELIDTAQEIILILDLSGSILRSNSYLEKLSGFRADEIQGKNAIETFLFKEDHAEVSSLLKHVIAGEQVDNLIFSLVTRSADEYRISWNSKVIKDADGNINSVLVIGHNITERLQIEKALYDSRARYQMLFDDAPVPLWEEDFTELFEYFDVLRKTGVSDFRSYFEENLSAVKICAQKVKILNINQATLELYDAGNKKELLGNLDNILTEKAYAVFREEIILFSSGLQEFESESEIKTLSGQLKIITLKIKIEKNEQGIVKALFATLDITKRKQAEVLLARHHNMLSSVAEISKHLLTAVSWEQVMDNVLLLLGEAACVSRVYLFEIQKEIKATNRLPLCRRRFEWCAEGITAPIGNRRLQNIDLTETGLEKWYETLADNQVLIRGQSEFNQAERSLLVPQNVRSFMSAPLFVNKHLWGFIGFDDCKQQRIWSDLEIAALESAAGVISGTIERELAKQALYENEQRFRGLIESTNDWIWEVNLNHVFTYSSPSVRKLLGYTVDEIIGKTLFELVPEDEAAQVADEFTVIFENKQPFTGRESINMHKDGYSVTLESNGVPIFNRFDGLTGYRGIDRDISERRQAEKVRLRQAEKQRDELVREVHHRIKNHLQGLMGLLKLRGKDIHEYNVIINESVTQIESIAIVYGLQASHPGAQIYFGQMLEAIIHSAAGLTQLTLSVTYGQESVSCEVDKNKAVALALVINELIINSIKHFLPDSDTDKIKIHHWHESNSIILTVSNPGRLPEKFDFHAGKSLGTGLELLKAMLPGKGAELKISEENNEVVAMLTITSPLLVDG